jgi:hypothetical protein
MQRCPLDALPHNEWKDIVLGKKSAQLFETAFSVFTEDGVIGEGGSGRVFRAKDESGQAVAIKVLDPSKSSTDKRKRFKNEINFSLRCQHPNIVLVIDHGVVHVHAGKFIPGKRCSVRFDWVRSTAISLTVS